MKMNISLIGVLAVFCVVLSMCAVSAGHFGAYDRDHDGQDDFVFLTDSCHNGQGRIIDYSELNGNEDAQNADEVSDDASQDESNVIASDNSADARGAANADVSAASTDSANTSDTDSNSTNAAQHNANMPITANPVFLVLLMVCVICAAVSSVKREK